MRPRAAVPTLPLSRFLVLAAVALGPAALPARAATAEGLDPARRGAVIERTLELLREKYVYPDVAEAMAKAVEEKDAKGGYDAMESASHLALTLTSDLQAVSHDRHLRVLFHPPASMFSDEDDAEAQERGRLRAVHENFGFRSVQRLPGNVGYIDLRNFHSVEHGGSTATAAMNLVSNTDALIFDLR